MRWIPAAHLYSGVNLVDVRDAAEYGLHLFRGQDGSPHLAFLLQWTFKELQNQKETDISAQQSEWKSHATLVQPLERLKNHICRTERWNWTNKTVQ